MGSACGRCGFRSFGREVRLEVPEKTCIAVTPENALNIYRI
jgi:hypothetical protein